MTSPEEDPRIPKTCSVDGTVRWVCCGRTNCSDDGNVTHLVCSICQRVYRLQIGLIALSGAPRRFIPGSRVQLLRDHSFVIWGKTEIKLNADQILRVAIDRTGHMVADGQTPVEYSILNPKDRRPQTLVTLIPDDALSVMPEQMES